MLLVYRELFMSLIFVVPGIVSAVGQLPSNIVINEVKLWGIEQFVELKNSNKTATLPVAGNFSLFLVENPEAGVAKGVPIPVFKVLDISNLTEIKGGGIVTVNASFGEVINENSTIGVVLYPLTDELKEGDNVTLENSLESMVFTHTSDTFTLLSFLLPGGYDHSLDLSVNGNQSLGICDETLQGIHVLMETSPGKKNLCGTPEKTLTTVETTTVNVTGSTDQQTVQTTVSSTNTTESMTTIISSTNTSETLTTPSATSTGTTNNSTSPSIVIAQTTTKKTLPTPGPSKSLILINEVSLMTKNPHKYVELLGPRNYTFKNTVLQLKNAVTGKLLLNKTVVQTDAQGFTIFVFEKDEFNVPALAVLLYELNTTSSDTGKLLDSLVISVDGSVDKGEMEKYQYSDIKPALFIFNSSRITFPDEEMSISRCPQGVPIEHDTRNFVIAYSTLDEPNNCTTYYHKYIQLKLKDAKCKPFRVNSALKKEVADSIVEATGVSCQCGISAYAFQVKTVHCSDGVVLESVVRTVTKPRLDDFIQFFIEYVNNTKSITIDNKKYAIDNSCYESCYNHAAHITNKGSGKGNISVTVVVVVICVVVFLAIVGVIILYLKKKKNGLLQFSMVRLEEDNGLLMNDAKEVRFREESAIII